MIAAAPPATASSPVTKRPAARLKMPKRLTSLDAFRGFIMCMLLAEGFGITQLAALPESAPVWTRLDREVWQKIAFHFRHPEWESLFGYGAVSFWDLIQPAFMFMVGVAMPYSDRSRTKQGHSRLRRFLHTLGRSLILVLLGVFLYSVGHERTNWIFPNVLAQIGLGYTFTWLIMKLPLGGRFTAVFFLLAGFWVLFRLYPPPDNYDYAAVGVAAEDEVTYDGAFAPWSKNGNAAFRFDQWLLPRLRTPQPDAEIERQRPSESALQQVLFSNPEPYGFNRGGYTTLNFIPSIATMVLGVLCGQLLMSDKRRLQQLLILAAAAAGCLLAGVLMHHYVCPVIKRIWTPSWVLFSGGYVIGMLLIFVLLFDVLPLKRLAWPLTVVGMNSILMYIGGQLLHEWVAQNVVEVHLTGALQALGRPQLLDPQWYLPVTQHCLTFLFFWLTAAWLYRRRIFVRI